MLGRGVLDLSELPQILIESFMEGGYILGKIYTAQLEGFANLLGEIISEKLVLKNEIREFKQELLDKQYNIDIEKES